MQPWPGGSDFPTSTCRIPDLYHTIGCQVVSCGQQAVPPHSCWVGWGEGAQHTVPPPPAGGYVNSNCVHGLGSSAIS